MSKKFPGLKSDDEAEARKAPVGQTAEMRGIAGIRWPQGSERRPALGSLNRSPRLGRSPA